MTKNEGFCYMRMFADEGELIEKYRRLSDEGRARISNQIECELRIDAEVAAKRQASQRKGIEAAKKACCHDFISALLDGYDTVVGEGGASLSGGEKQRISIARAMMKDAPVIFLDEATANVDPENENELMRAIQALTAEKTVVMIAHRLKTVENADQILVIDHGRIVQQGTHSELMEQDGIYKNFISERREAASWKVRA